MILRTFTRDLEYVSREDILARLSLAEPKVLLFPYDYRIVDTPRDFLSAWPPRTAYRDLCHRLAAMLAEHEAIIAVPYPKIKEQLKILVDYAPPPRDPSPHVPQHLAPRQSPPDFNSRWFEPIQAGAIELTAQRMPNDVPAPDAAEVVNRAIFALSKQLAADPPFPDLLQHLSEYYAAKRAAANPPSESTPPQDVDGLTEAAPIPDTPSPPEYPSELAKRQRIAAAAPTRTQQTEPAPPLATRLRVRRTLAWPE
jgi:hypothetical protein